MTDTVHSSGAGRLQEWFGSDRRFWRFLSVLLGAISLFKGIRFPGPWAATQAQLDYRNGLVKRGLFGTLFTSPLGLNHYGRFAAFSFLVLAVALLLLTAFVRKTGIRRIGSGEALAVFASGAGLFYLGNLNGYDDVLLLAVSLALLLVPKPFLRFVVAVPVCVAAMLVHEGFLLLLLPVVLFSFIADTLQERLTWSRASCLVTVLVASCFLTGALVALRRPVTPQRAFDERQQIVSRVDFPVRDAFFAVLTRSALANAKLTAKEQFHGEYQLSNLSGIVALLPTVAVQLAYLHLVCVRASSLVPRRIWLLALAASLAPLLMCGLGYDTQRWYAFASISTLIVTALLMRAMPAAHLALPLYLRNASLLAIALGMAVSEGMLTVKGNEYPFVRSVHTLLTSRNVHALQPAEW